MTNPWSALCDYAPVRNRIESGEIVPLFACESGSRTWGFASKDSDYDLRWVYRHTTDWYLSLAEHRDVIESETEYDGIKVDAVGWDLRKFLQLTKKSNAMPFEWVYMCGVYYSDPLFQGASAKYMPDYFSPIQMAYHYRGMAAKHFMRYMEDRDEVTHKKYLYILRALWLMEWYLENDTFANPHFMYLMDNSNAPEVVKDAAGELYLDKISGEEVGMAPPNYILDLYLAERIDHWKRGFGVGVSGSPSWDGLDKFFISCLGPAKKVRRQDQRTHDAYKALDEE